MSRFNKNLSKHRFRRVSSFSSVSYNTPTIVTSIKMLWKELNLSTKAGTGVRMQRGKMCNALIKHNISRDVYVTRWEIQALETLVLLTISLENTLFRSELKLAFIEGAKIWPTHAPKNSKRLLISFDMKQALNRCLKLYNLARGMIDYIHSNTKSFVPKFKRCGSLGQKGQSNLDNVPMFSFC